MEKETPDNMHRETEASPEVLEAYQVIDELKSELDGLRPLKPEQVENLKVLYDVDLTYNSNAIEGSTISYNETKLILERGVTIGGKPLREHLEVVNHKEAIDFIESIAHERPQDIREHDLLSIHNIILRGIDTRNAGKYRAVRVGVNTGDEGLFEFCEPLEVPERMKEFYAWLQSPTEDHPVKLAGDAHYKLVAIHPFVDGNGRTARLLMNLVLMQTGYPPAVIKMKDRDEYIAGIREVQKGGDLNRFYKFIARAVKESLNLHLETIKKDIYYN